MVGSRFEVSNIKAMIYCLSVVQAGGGGSVHFVLTEHCLNSHQISIAPVVEQEFHIMDVQQLCDAIMSLSTNISDECVQHLFESGP